MGADHLAPPRWTTLTDITTSAPSVMDSKFGGQKLQRSASEAAGQHVEC